MKYADINKRFTEIVAEYISKGYTINTASMRGSQGEIAKVDLTNGTEIIRVMVNNFSDLSNGIDGIQITVGRSTDKALPNSSNDWNTIWCDHLEVISQEQFFKLGEDRKGNVYYGTQTEAMAASDLRLERYLARQIEHQAEDLTRKALEIAKCIIRRRFGAKRIYAEDIKVSKYKSSYTVMYKGKSYKLH